MAHESVPDEVRATYDIVAEDYAAHFSGTEAEEAVDLAMIQYFVSHLPAGVRGVLDAGCGAGRMCRYLADRGCDVHGVDLSPGMIRMARRDHPGIDTQVASITALPFADGLFDGVFYWYSIIHVPDHDLPTTFRETRRVLRPSARGSYARPREVIGRNRPSSSPERLATTSSGNERRRDRSCPSPSRLGDIAP